jgi:hypothetical protein
MNPPQTSSLAPWNGIDAAFLPPPDPFAPALQGCRERLFRMVAAARHRDGSAELGIENDAAARVESVSPAIFVSYEHRHGFPRSPRPR